MLSNYKIIRKIQYHHYLHRKINKNKNQFNNNKNNKFLFKNRNKNKSKSKCVYSIKNLYKLYVLLI